MHSNKKKYICSPTLFLSLILILVITCGKKAPVDGVLTEITSVDGRATHMKSPDGYFNVPIANTILQSFAGLQSYIQHGGVSITGEFTLYFAGYDLNDLNPQAFFIVLLKRDGSYIQSGFTLKNVDLAPMPDAPPSFDKKYFTNYTFSFLPAFDDPNLSLPESHIYNIEFWECIGKCTISDSKLKTDKKAEIILNYSIGP